MYIRRFFLTEQVSAIIQNNRPPKFKDPSCPSISCVIGNSKIEKALLDLGVRDVSLKKRDSGTF